MNADQSSSYPAIQSVPEGGNPASPEGAPEGLPEEQSQSPKGPRRFLIPGLILAFLLGSIGWLLVTRIILPIIIFSGIKPKPFPVQLTDPKTATIQDSSDYIATLQSRQSVSLQSRVSGQVSQIYVKAGDRVEAGQILLQIDASVQQALVNSQAALVEGSAADVDSARADAANARDTLGSLQAQRNSRVADLNFAQQEYTRFKDLFSQGATSKQILDQKLNAYQSAQASLDQAEANIRAQQSTINRTDSSINRSQRTVAQSEASLAQQQAQLQFYTITAPFSGIVGDIPVKVGDYVNNVQSSTQLLTITQNKELEMQISIPIEKAPELRRGAAVELLDTQSQSKVLQTGRIFFIAPNVDTQTQSVLVKALFTNTDGKLRADQFMRARVVWNTKPGLLVPTSAISRLAGKDFVFVAKAYQDTDCEKQASKLKGPKVSPDQLTAFQQPVKLGKIVGNDQEVLEGLGASDRIIATGILQLQNCKLVVEAAEPAQK